MKAATPQSFSDRLITHFRWRSDRAKRAATIGASRLARATVPKNALTFPLGIYGRLGNQLFQIAGTIGLAHDLGADAVFPRNWAYRPYYSLPETFYGRPVAVARSGQAASHALSIPEQARVYLQDITLWKQCRDDVYRWFQPSEVARQAAIQGYSDILGLRSKTALHVRRGDYLTNPAMQPCPIVYYEQAIELVRSDDPSTQFLVFSDDLDWCRQNLRLPGARFIEGNPDWLDMTLMMQCDHHICANSTFSWWGAFLSSDPNPVFPWLTGTTWPLRIRHPEGWREIGVEPDGRSNITRH
jgi:Glycosyl transferase family 11